MKKIIFIVFTVLIITSCTKDTYKDFLGDQTESEKVEFDTATNKKGAAFTYRIPTWSTRLARLNVHWHYSWGLELQETKPANVNYAPMFWGKWAPNNQDNIDYMKDLIAQGKVDYVLGFNEPDGSDQANMTVEEAIERWPLLEALNVPLVSPAPINIGNDWMKQFMARAEEENLRIDYVAMHWYGGSNALAFIKQVKDAYDLYQKPIWITEFAVADWQAPSLEANRYSKAEVLQFMKEVLPALDKMPFVYKYAWFNGSPNGRVLGNSVLFDENDNLTELGQFYADHTPNTEIGPGDDSFYVSDTPVTKVNLLLNGGFEDAVKEPWGGFKSGIATEESKTGNYSGRIENNDGSLFQKVAVEAGKTYELKFSSKWSSAVNGSFNAIVRNESDNTQVFTTIEIPMGTDWNESETEFTIPEGVTEIRVQIFKPQRNPALPPIYFDDFLLNEK
tara:strand:- start:18516 stop:19859 length:1344 start_codon:yes stop_codon:yes gene_type:complete